ncbi:transposase [Sulfitobacter sp.]|uniref:transposase n=1 Tax=Sulfitobacter sp. TaxID=1903071 RepID=UPI003002D4B8
MSTTKVFEVWDINVPISPKGRRKWPQTIREMAVKQVIDSAKIIDIAKETGATKSLVAKWVNDAADRKSTPNFVVLVKNDANQDTKLSPSQSVGQLTCQVQLGDTGISVPSGYPATHLAEILQAIRASQ